jgi:glycosyltransferase involved in cell wall biosynthesis/tetratricopeptide (TPR) repeat protein
VSATEPHRPSATTDAAPVGRLRALGWRCLGVAFYYASHTHRRRPAARRSVAAFRRAIAANPSSAAIWAWLGKAQSRARDWQDARRSWHAAIDLDPLNPVARAGLDRLKLVEVQKLLTKGEGEAALALLGPPDALAPARPEMIRMTIWGLALTGRADEAAQHMAHLSAAGADDPESRVRIGQALRKNGRLDEAAGQFRRALAADPKNRRARIFLARTIEKTSPDEAVALWQGLLGDGLVGVEARQVLDRIALAAEKLRAKEEEKDRQGAIRRRSKTPRLPSGFRVWERADDGEEADFPEGDSAEDAGSTVSAAIEEKMRPALRGRLDSALVLEGRGEITEAANAYVEMWREAGDAPELLRAYGEFQLRQGNASAAYQLFLRVADDFAHGPFACRQMAKIQIASGKPEEAERIYRDALIEFDDSGLIVDCACFLADCGRTDDALQTLRRLDWDDRGAAPAYRELARHLVQAGRAESAIAVYAIGIERFPQSGALYRDQAKLLNESGRFSEAVAVLDLLVERKPKDAANWSQLIYIIARAERHAEATHALARARAALGDGVDALAALARAAERALMHEEAEALLDEAVAGFPLSALAFAERGGYFLRQGALRAALSDLSRSVGLDPSNPAVAQDCRYAGDALAFLGATTDGAFGEEEILTPEALFAVIRERRARDDGGFRFRPGRVMIITSSLTAGGAERQAANTVSELIRGRDGVTSVVLGAASLSSRRRRNFYLSRIQNLPIDIVSLEAMAIDNPLDHPAVSPFAEILGFFTADIRFDIARWIVAIDAQKPEVVHTWQDYINIAAGVAAILLGVRRVVLGTRNTRPDNKYRRLKRYMRTAYQELTLLPSVLLINNSIAGARDYEAWLGRPEGSCSVIWNGLNLSSLTEQAREQPDIRATLGIPEDAPVVGGVFRMTDEKRPILWLDTAAIVAEAFPDAHFIMCGDGVLYHDVKAYAARLGLAERVHMPGMISNIGAWYGAMSIFLLASRKEGLPNVLIEAQAFGMPVVSANVGGAAEVVMKDRTGFVVDDADAERLADRLVWCLRRPDWMKDCAAVAPGFVNATFSLDAMAAKTLAAYALGGDPVGGRAAAAPAADAAGQTAACG